MSGGASKSSSSSSAGMMEVECGIKAAGVEAVAAEATAEWMDQRNCGVIGMWSVP